MGNISLYLTRAGVASNVELITERGYLNNTALKYLV